VCVCACACVRTRVRVCDESGYQIRKVILKRNYVIRWKGRAV